MNICNFGTVWIFRPYRNDMLQLLFCVVNINFKTMMPLFLPLSLSQFLPSLRGDKKKLEEDSGRTYFNVQIDVLFEFYGAWFSANASQDPVIDSFWCQNSFTESTHDTDQYPAAPCSHDDFSTLRLYRAAPLLQLQISHHMQRARDGNWALLKGSSRVATQIESEHSPSNGTFLYVFTPTSSSHYLIVPPHCGTGLSVLSSLTSVVK